MTISAASLERLEQNLHAVKERIARACERSQRPVSGLRLVAVTKSANVDWISGLIALGQLDLAENRPQQLAQRAAVLPPSVRWHMIGHLQRNKVDQIWPVAEWIHSVDSFRLLRRVADEAAKSPLPRRILLEVNVSGEASKSGFAPDELLHHWDEIQAVAAPVVSGLMTMAPLADDAEQVRPVFRGLRELRDRLVERSAGTFSLTELSMGMSGDFEIAVEEGATMVRIGSRLFEGL